MPAEALLVVADEALRQVLTIALAADGATVRPVADAAAARAALATHAPDLLLLDGTMRLPLAADAWAATYAPDIPLVLLSAGWDDRPSPLRPGVTPLRMPFGLKALRHALAEAQSAHIRR